MFWIGFGAGVAATLIVIAIFLGWLFWEASRFAEVHLWPTGE